MRVCSGRQVAVVLLSTGLAGPVAAQAPCETAFTDVRSQRELAAFGRMAEIPPVWDDYSPGRHPLLLIADTTAHRGREGAPVCAAIWRAGAPLIRLELEASPRFATPLYGMVNLDEAGPGMLPGYSAYAESMRRITPSAAALLRAHGVTRAVVLRVPVDFSRLGRLGEILASGGQDPALMQATLAVHETFHLHSQFPAWLDQPRTYDWPEWDVQPDRRELVERCYRGTPGIAAVLGAEIDALNAAYRALYPEGEGQAPDTAAALRHANRFIDLRAARRTLQDTTTVARDDARIPCHVAEDIMELEEGVAQWIGHASAVRAGLTTTDRTSYVSQQPEVFYLTGPLQLWILDGLLGHEAMRSLTSGIARSDGPDGAVFGRFVERIRGSTR